MNRGSEEHGWREMKQREPVSSDRLEPKNVENKTEPVCSLANHFGLWLMGPADFL